MDLYSLLDEIIEVKVFKISANDFDDESKKRLECDEDKYAFELLKNIASLGAKIKDKGIEFYPFMVFDGQRYFSLDDMNDRDYQILENVEVEKLPLNLRARVSDVLWTHKKHYASALIATRAYFELFKMKFSVDDWVGTLDSIKRAIQISAQIKEKNIFEECCQYVYDIIINIDGQDDGFLSLRLIDILLVQKYGDYNKLISVADNIISSDKNNVGRVEQAYMIKIECYNNLKNSEAVRITNISLAEYYISFADKVLNENMQGAMRAEHFLQKAIVIFRNNKESKRAEETHRKLVEVQKEIPKNMVPIKLEVDYEKYKKIIDANMEGLSFEESVIRITQFVVFHSKDKIKEKVLEEYYNSPISYMFGKNLINATGQTVLALPPIDMKDPEKDSSILDMHIHQKLLDEQRILGDVWLQYMFYYVRNKHSFEVEDLKFITENNAIIPAGRERIVRSALFMVLKGQYYEAMHILAPQIENLFRCIAKEVGGLTVTLEDDGTSKEKVLSSIFDLPELLDCYDNDILFVFKGLLNEQAGANIRNEVAHGLMTEIKASTGVSLFFAAAVLKLLSMTSLKVFDLYKGCEKLHTMCGFENEISSASQNP